MRATTVIIALSLAVAARALEDASPGNTARVNAWVDSVKQAAGLVRQLVAAGKKDQAAAKLGAVRLERAVGAQGPAAVPSHRTNVAMRSR